MGWCHFVPTARTTASSSTKPWRSTRERGRALPRVLIPPCRRAQLVDNLLTAMRQRNRNVRCLRKVGRRAWHKASGYSLRSLAENAVFRYKTIVGDTLLPWSSSALEGQPLNALWARASSAVWSLISLSPTASSARDLDDAFYAATTLLPSLAYLLLLALAVLAKLTMPLALRAARYWLQLATEPLPSEVSGKFQPFTLLGVFVGVLGAVATTTVKLIELLS